MAAVMITCTQGFYAEVHKTIELKGEKKTHQQWQAMRMHKNQQQQQQHEING